MSNHESMNSPNDLLEQDLQKAFDKMVIHLFTQREVAYMAGNCWYRSPNGLKCAVGALIPDELYHERIELKSPTELQKYFGFWKGNNDMIRLLESFQEIHDDRPPNSWEARFKGIARSLSLNTEVFNNVEPIQ